MLTTFWAIVQQLKTFSSFCYRHHLQMWKILETGNCVNKNTSHPPFLLQTFCKHIGVGVVCLWWGKYYFFFLELKLVIDSLQQSYINSFGNRHKGWGNSIMQGNRNNLWGNGKGTISYYLWVLTSLQHKTMGPVGSLWASVSKAADEVNTKEISVSTCCVALSFVNIYNRFAAFL